MKTHKIVKVEWNDSANHRGWNSLDRAKKFDLILCVSSGILVKVKKGSIGVTHTLDSEDDVAETIVISRKSIRKMEVLATFKA